MTEPQDEAYQAGHRDGLGALPIQGDMIRDQVTSGPYRRGLQDGRTARVDAELIEVYGAELSVDAAVRAAFPPVPRQP